MVLSREGVDFSEPMFDFCIQELCDKASHFSKTGHISVLDTEAAVVKSDSAIPPSLQASLKAAVKPLEDVPDRQKDWHPGTDEKVLDLVHPSLYPLMYGRSFVPMVASTSPIVSRVMEGEEVLSQNQIRRTCSYLHDGQRPWDSESSKNTPNYWSDKYQWLPSEVASESNEEVEITSYTNNLHPVHHRELYGVLEKIIARTIPLWSDTLSSIDPEHSLRILRRFR
ncbi:hypothetical protein L218DRAFT_1023983 [Marasmius fiardii PR-910]|nr:hypothetical protein L218DRAFT_1023983 [Marasmius fiardii PR-910]